MAAIQIADLNNGKVDVDHVATWANSTALTATDRMGRTKRTLAGIDADAEFRMDSNDAEAEFRMNVIDAAAVAQRAGIAFDANAMLAALGYQVPVTYEAGLEMITPSQTVAYEGNTYAPVKGELPFTTSGTFEVSKFRLIQGVSGADLAAVAGLPAYAFSGTEVQSILDNALAMQSYTAMQNHAGRALGIRITTPGIAGVFQYNPALPNTTDLGTRFPHASGVGAWERLFDGEILSSWFLPDKTGSVSATAAIQAFFDAAAAREVSSAVINSGTYLLTNPNNDAAYTCAVVIDGLKNCKVRCEPGAKFVVGPGGAGTAEFAFFRVEQTRFAQFSKFDLDGSGIFIAGTAANRSNGFICVNFDVNNMPVDLPVSNFGLEFDYLNINNVGGGITVARRSTTHAPTPVTDCFSVHDCQMRNLLGVDHGVSMSYVRRATVRNMWFWNDIETVTIQANMAVDASAGCEDVVVENIYVRGFAFGAKSETHLAAGPAANETRPSKRVSFFNCTFEEIGDPTLFVYPGPSGGDTYGLKLNSQDYVAEGITVSARTIGVTTGGLSFGIAALNTHNMDSNCRVVGSRVKGSRYGIIHNDTTPTTRACSVFIGNNRCDDNLLYGILAQANCLLLENWIYRAGESAIIFQTPNNSVARRNFAINCASTPNSVTGTKVVFYQAGPGSYAGLMELTDNVIMDSRGASAANHGYFLHSGATRTNALIFRPGYTSGLLTAVTFDPYFSIIGDSQQLSGTTAPAPRVIRTTNSPAITAPWNAMPWNQGDRAVFATPSVGSAKGWVCTVTGTPGTWVSEGNL